MSPVLVLKPNVSSGASKDIVTMFSLCFLWSSTAGSILRFSFTKCNVFQPLNRYFWKGMRKETKSQDGPRSVFLIHVDFACSKIRALFLSHRSEDEESGIFWALKVEVSQVKNTCWTVPLRTDIAVVFSKPSGSLLVKFPSYVSSKRELWGLKRQNSCNIQYISKRQNCNIPGVEPVVSLRAFISSKYTSGNHEYSLQMILKETNLRFNMSRFPRIVLRSF